MFFSRQCILEPVTKTTIDQKDFPQTTNTLPSTSRVDDLCSHYTISGMSNTISHRVHHMASINFSHNVINNSGLGGVSMWKMPQHHHGLTFLNVVCWFTSTHPSSVQHQHQRLNVTVYVRDWGRVHIMMIRTDDKKPHLTRMDQWCWRYRHPRFWRQNEPNELVTIVDLK